MSTPSLESLFLSQREAFPAFRDLGGRVLLNSAAGSQLPERAIAAMVTTLRSGFGNEGSVFTRLEACVALKNHAHQATADLIGANPDEIMLGANTTTNLLTISRALARMWKKGDRVLVSEACHEANIAPWLLLREQGIEVDFIPMLADTHLDYEWLEGNCDARTRLVSVALSSNTTGTLHDVKRAIAIAHNVGALASVDAAHYAPHRPVDVPDLGADLLFFSIYKCFGPHLGAAFVRRSLCAEIPADATPLGAPGSALRFETGTRNFEAYSGWLGAIEYLEELGRSAAPLLKRETHGRVNALRSAMLAISAWEEELTLRADAALADVPNIILYRQPAEDERSRLGVFSFNLRGKKPIDVARALEEAHIEAVFGHNGAIRTLRRLAPEFEGTAIRLSIAHYNRHADLDAAVGCIRKFADD